MSKISVQNSICVKIKQQSIKRTEKYCTSANIDCNYKHKHVAQYGVHKSFTKPMTKGLL